MSSPPSSYHLANLIDDSRLAIPLMPSRGSCSRKPPGTPTDSKYSRPAGSLNNLNTPIVASSSIAVIRSVLRTLWIHGTCLSPIPSMRCDPKPFMSKVGHWRASLAAILAPNRCLM